jgi:hypothetical protein
MSRGPERAEKGLNLVGRKIEILIRTDLYDMSGQCVAVAIGSHQRLSVSKTPSMFGDRWSTCPAPRPAPRPTPRRDAAQPNRSNGGVGERRSRTYTLTAGVVITCAVAAYAGKRIKSDMARMKGRKEESPDTLGSFVLFTF